MSFWFLISEFLNLRVWYKKVVWKHNSYNRCLFGFLYQNFLYLKVWYKKVFWKIFLITDVSERNVHVLLVSYYRVSWKCTCSFGFLLPSFEWHFLGNVLSVSYCWVFVSTGQGICFPKKEFSYNRVSCIRVFVIHNKEEFGRGKKIRWQ